MSSSRRSKRNGDDEMSNARNRSDSIPSSTAKRKSSKKSDPDRDGGFNPTSTSFSSTTQSPYPGAAAPSVASSYATAKTSNPTNVPYQPPDLIRNESMQGQRAAPESDMGKESRTKRSSERRQGRGSDSDNAKSSRPSTFIDKDEKRRSSRKEKPKRTDSERALDNHQASMVENQFPGEFPSTFAEPYRPPGLAADYYGDHGESVASQPGVRPAPPSIITAPNQAHLHEATIEAAPPPEPSSLGQVGAAASFYGGTSDFESDPPPKPSKNGKRPGVKPARQPVGAASLRSSPDPAGRPGPVPYSATGSAPATMAGAAPAIGAAAEYFSTQFNPDITEGGSNTTAPGYFANSSMPSPPGGMQTSIPGSIPPPLADQRPSSGSIPPPLANQRPSSGSIPPPLADQRPSSGSNLPMYGAAAVGIAAAGAGAYYASQHTTAESHATYNTAGASYGPQNLGQSFSRPQNYQSQASTQQRRRRTGPFSKILDFFQDPSAVAEYEAYTEAIGVCKYCFEPGSSPRDAPRKHHYNRRYSDGRYGSSTRVDKLNRYQSSEDEKRRRSNGKKWAATGLAGYGLAKMSEAAANKKNGFDDTYSVKSGRPEGSSRVSFAADERVSRASRTRRDDRSYPPQDSGRDTETQIRKDKRTGELYEEKVLRRRRRRRESSPSDRLSKGAALSTGVAAAGFAAMAGGRSRSNSPKKNYYAKRVSSNYSFVDLSATDSGALGFTSFFSSPSANQRKGKKSKGFGFFNFANGSSSSSDADLAFGAGSVRRKKSRRDDPKSRDNDSVHAEILGLAATGVALAAEAGRQEQNGKRRADLLVVKEPRQDQRRRHDKRRPHSSASESEDGHDDWIDASDDESSVDSTLAYGGGLSARPSRESLSSNDGTNKWAWRWNKGKKPPKKPSEDLSRFESAGAGLAGVSIGEAAPSSGRFGLADSTTSLQSMQQLDPIPMSDTTAFAMDRKTSAISPRTNIPPPVFSATTTSAPLEHPRPVAPISPAYYSGQASAPAQIYGPGGPPVFSQYPPYTSQVPLSESPKQLPVGREKQQPYPAEQRPKRRNSSPASSYIPDNEPEDKSRRRASARDSVKFDLTEEQTERDRRAQARRRSRREDRRGEKRGDGSNFQQEASLERERDEISSSKHSSTDARTPRESEIEKESDRQREAQRSKRADTWPAVVAIGAGVAGVAAMAAVQSNSAQDEPRVDREERQSRRKSAMKKTTTSAAVDDDRSDSQQRRIARMAATRVRSPPSPVHEDYASYFIPPELAENVKEHNMAAEHHDHPTPEIPQIVEVTPRTAQRKDTFDPFVYRPFGLEPEDDPRRYPWPVPLLDIIEPTPPVSVRGDMSPLPTQNAEPPEVPEIPEISEVAPERRQKRSSSVTWGEHRTHEYEVITPLEDHEEFVPPAAYESSQPAIDLAERTGSDVKAELSEPVPVPEHANGVPSASAKEDVPAPADIVEEPQPKSNYGQDIEFAAVLAAAVEGAGFNPAIVVDDPTYHRRDSPPGSEGASFYRPPYTETVSDLGTFYDYSLPPQRGFVEGSLPPTPTDEVSNDALDADRSKESKPTGEAEQLDVEPKVPGGFNVFDYLDEPTPGAANSVDDTTAENAVTANVAQDKEKHPKERNESSDRSNPGTQSLKSQASKPEPSKRLKRSSTLDEVSFEASPEKPGPQISYASDPEGAKEKPGPQISYASDPEGAKEKSRSKKSPKGSNHGAEAVIIGAAAAAVPTVDELMGRDQRRRKLDRGDDDYYDKIPPVSVSEPGANTSVDSKRSRRKSERDSDIWDDAKSVASSPAEIKDDRETSKKSKKKSKRDSDIPDDETMSVSSLPADLNGDKASARRSKEKKSGGIFGFFSASKSETSSSPQRSSKEWDRQSRNGLDTKSEDFDEPKRKSKRKSRDKVVDDSHPDLRRSRSSEQPSARDESRQQSPEDEFVSSEEAARDDEQTEDRVSFLGERPEMPTVLDGASGSTPKAKPEAEQNTSAQPPVAVADPVSSTVRSRSVSPGTIPAALEGPELLRDEPLSPSAQRDQLRQRHLADIRTSDVLSSPLATSSPTAVPLYFRRLPVSPSFARSASVGSASTSSPLSPLVTPRTRQGRPTSTEFRNSKEFRPLYLVERHSSIKQPDPEGDETYPSLPSSRTSSAHPSMENLRGDDLGESLVEERLNLFEIRDRRHSFSHWRDERPTSPDYLDSKTVTPTATEFPQEFRREKPKYEFHSPSELLEDPSTQLAGFEEHQSPHLSPMALPSAGSPPSPVTKNDSGSHYVRPSSPVPDQPSADYKNSASIIGLGLAGTAVSALAASEVVDHQATAVTRPGDAVSEADNSQVLPPVFTMPGMPITENVTPIDLPISHAPDISSPIQGTDDDVTLQPISGESAVEDKKKSEILDTADDSVEPSLRSRGQELEDVGSVATRSSTEPLPAPEASVRDLSPDVTASVVSFPQRPEPDVLDTQDPSRMTVADVENPDNSAISHAEEQALPESTTGIGSLVGGRDITSNIVPNEAPAQETPMGDKVALSTVKPTEQKEEIVLASQPSEPSPGAPSVEDQDIKSQGKPREKPISSPDNGLTTSVIPGLPDQRVEASHLSASELVPATPTQLEQRGLDISANRALVADDDTDRTEGHDEKGSHDSFLESESATVPAITAAPLPRTSALEEAFASAQAARGIAPEVSPEEALDAFRPRPALEPLLGNGRLDTIPEASREGSNIDSTEVNVAMENLGQDQGKSSTSKSKKDKKKDRKSKRSKEVEAFAAQSDGVARDATDVLEQDEAEILNDRLTTAAPLISIPISDPSINPFGDDYVLHSEDGIKDKAAETISKSDKADAMQPEGASAAASPVGSPVQTGGTLQDLNEPIEELSWALTSKKDKKKGKKGRASVLISEASTPITEMSSTESVDQPKAKQLNTDTFPVPTKKGKKSKKKGQAVDWTTEDAPPVQEDSLEQSEEPVGKTIEMEQDFTKPARADDPPMLEGKKSKKSKKKGQALDWTTEDAPPVQEASLEQSEEPVGKTVEMEQDFTKPARADDPPMLEGKKSKKSKKKIQALDLSDEFGTPQTEESIDTATESQRNAPAAEAGTEDLAWATTKKGKKDKKKGKKSVLWDKATSEIDLPPENETASIPDTVQEHAPAVEDEPPASVPVVLYDEKVPQDKRSIPGAFDEASMLQNDISVQLEQPSLPGGEALVAHPDAAIPLDEIPSASHDLNSSKATEASEVPASDSHDQQLPDAVGASQLPVPELSETRVSESVEPIKSSGSELHGPDRTVNQEPSKLQDPNQVSDLPGIPKQAQETVEAPAQSSALTRNPEPPIVRDLNPVSEPGIVPQQVVEVSEDQTAIPLRDSHWASVFTELKQRTVLESTGQYHKILAPEEIEHERQDLAPNESSHHIDMPGDKADIVTVTDSSGDHNHLDPTTQEMSTAETRDSEIGIPATHTDDDDAQPHRPTAEEHSPSIIPQTVPVVHVSHDQKQEQAQPAMVAELATHTDSQAVAEDQEIRDVTHEGGHPKVIDELASLAVSQSVVVAHDSHEQRQEQAYAPAVEGLISHPVSQSDTVAEDMDDQMHEHAHPAATEESASNEPSQPVMVVLNMDDQIDEAQHRVPEPGAAQEMHYEVSERAQGTTQESVMGSLVERQDAISTNDPEVSVRRLESEAPEGVGSENKSQLQPPNDEKKSTDQSVEAAPLAEEPADDFPWHLTKRGKKDKKKSKSKQLTFDETVEQSSDSSRSRDIIPGSTAAAATMKSKFETSSLSNTVEEASAEADASSRGPTTKGKKDKKKKKASAVAEDISTPASDDIGEDRSSTALLASLADLSKATPAEKSTAEATHVGKDLYVENEIPSTTEIRQILPMDTENESTMIPEKTNKLEALLPLDELTSEHTQLYAAQTTEDNGILTEPAPLQRGSIVSKGELVAVQEEPALVQEMPTPVKEELAPAQKQPTFMEKVPVFVPKEPTHMQEESTLVHEKPTFAEEEPALVQEQSTLVHEKPAPMQEEPTSVEEERTPAQEDLTFAEKEPALGQQESTVVHEKPTPKQEEPSPVQQERASVQEEPTPVQEEPTRVLEEPTPVQNEPAFQEKEPVLVQEKTLSMQEEPALRHESLAPVQEQPTSVQEEPTTVQEEPTSVQEEPTSVQEEPTTVQEEPTLTHEKPTPVQEVPNDDYWANIPKKKGKKDKKKRSSTVATSGTATPQTEDEPAVAKDAVQSAAFASAEPAETDEWAFPVKKSKDKKKKKALLSSTDKVAESNLEEKMQALPDSGNANDIEIGQDAVERTAAVGPSMLTVEQDSGEQMVESSGPELHDSKGYAIAPEREPAFGTLGDGSIAHQVKDQPLLTHEPSLQRASILEHEPAVGTKEQSSSTFLNQSEGGGSDGGPSEPKAVLAEQLEASSPPAKEEHPGKPEPVQEQEHSVLHESGPTVGPEHATAGETVSEIRTVAEHTPNAEQQRTSDETTEGHREAVLPDINIPEAAAENEAWAYTKKKGKKDKKTKRKSAIDPEEAILGMTSGTTSADGSQGPSGNISAEHLVPGETGAVAKLATQASESSGPPDSTQDATPVAKPEEDTWGFPTKKSKKDKKEKRQSTFDESSEVPSAPDSTQDATPVAEPEEDTWGFPTTKPKKDKKKKRQSTFDESSEVPGAPMTPPEPSHIDKDVVISANQLAQNVTEEKLEALETVEPGLVTTSAPLGQIAEDDFGSRGKKRSKKDKKKKKTLLPWVEDNDASTDQPTETSTPVNEWEFGISGEQRAALETTEEPINLPEVKAGDFDSSQVLDSAVIADDSLPLLPEHFNAANTAETTTIKGHSSDAKELTTTGDSATADDTSVDPGGRDLDSLEVQSRSLSIPATFEDVAKSGSQSLLDPQVSSVEKERSALPTNDEPQITMEPIPRQTLPDHDVRHPFQPDNAGLGIATLVSEAGTSQAIGVQNPQVSEELVSQHERPNYYADKKAIHDQEKQEEQTQPHSGYRPEILTSTEAFDMRPPQPTWSFANLGENKVEEQANRDSGIHVSDPTLIPGGYIQPTLRDSGYVPSPITADSREIAVHEENSHLAIARPPRPISPTSSSEDLRLKSCGRSPESHQLDTTREMDDPSLLPSAPHEVHGDQSEVPTRGYPSPVDSTTKDRSSALFNSSPSSRTEGYNVTPRLETRHMQAPTTDLHRSPSIHGHRSRDELRSLTPSRSPTRHLRQVTDAPATLSMQEASPKLHRPVIGPFPPAGDRDRDLSPPRTPLQTIHEHLPDTSHADRRLRPLSDVGSPDRGYQSVERSGGPAFGELDSRMEAERPDAKRNSPMPTGHPNAVEADREQLQPSATADHSHELVAASGVAALSGAAAALAAEELRPTSRDDRPRDTKSLGKSKSRSTSSKQLRHSQTSLENIASSSTHDPVREKGKGAARDMAEVYNGYGEFPGAPVSPTRPPSVRSRRSMQQLKDLEARLDQLASENRLLATAKLNAEQQLQDLHIAQSRTEHASQEALDLRDMELREKDETIAKLRTTLDETQREVARLTEVNEGLMATHNEPRSVHEQRFSQMEQQHTESQQQWQDPSRELEDLRAKHAELSTGMEELVRHELDTRLTEKNAEIERLYDELEDAKAKIRELQQQILVGQSDEIIIARDEDYFENACQQLCQHVQQWVLRFSKFSDTRVCRLTSEVRDEKVVDRFDNAILDGSDVDPYLRDRVRRRDVFMSVVMTMIWEYVFTRYLFGMDREQRQKLKQLEKNLSEVGPQSAVQRWRAMTLTLLSQRESFKTQRANDTEAVVQEIYTTLARFLPPPPPLQGQIQESLRNVMKAAVDLSIEMRTQRAQYIMLQPLQPEYDTNGDLAREVYFTAAMMNERSGETTSNEELDAQQAVVRMVLFPPVVKKGDDSGEGDEKIVVCPAQVLVARPGKDKDKNKNKDVLKATSRDRMSIDQANRSVQSFAPSVLDSTNVI